MTCHDMTLGTGGSLCASRLAAAGHEVLLDRWLPTCMHAAHATRSAHVYQHDMCTCVCMCVCVYIYIYIYVSLSLSLSLYIYIYRERDIHMYMITHVYVYTCLALRVLQRVLFSGGVFLSQALYICIYIYIYIYMYIHIYTNICCSSQAPVSCGRFAGIRQTNGQRTKILRMAN